jgi:hypothetical protein
MSNEVRDEYVKRLEDFVKEVASLQHLILNCRCKAFKCFLGRKAQEILEDA